MKCLLLFIIPLWFSSQSFVTSVDIIRPIHGMKNWIFGPPAPAVEESSLVLAVETNGRTYVTSNGFVASHMHDIYAKFLFACPSKPGTTQADINQTDSKTKNALFIEEIYEKLDPPPSDSEYIERKCESPVKPSILHAGSYIGDPEIDLYLVGYEIFLGEDIESYKIDAFNTADLKDKRFAWFNVYTIAYDRKQANVVNVFSPMLAYQNYYQFETTSAVDTPNEAHQAHINHLFGKETLYEENFDIVEIYGMENQEKVFQYLFGNDLTPFQNSDSVSERFLGAVYLAPLNTFQIPLAKQAALTFGNVAPMWNLVYDNSWEDLETYIEYLAKGLKGIHVITGAYGNLKISDKEIYLGPGNTVKVPAAFFKIVSYSPNVNEKYNMLIVTSNNPFDENDQVTGVCKRDQCEEFGWKGVQESLPILGRTSCCELTKENLRELKMAHMEELIDKTLDLNRVPHWRDHRVTLNLKAYIFDQIDEESDLPADSERYKNEDMPIGLVYNQVIFSDYISIMYNNFVKPYFVEKINLQVA